MPYSVVDLYQKILPKTNCGDCGYPTCLAFASMVVSEKVPLETCPHIDKTLQARVQQELDRQHAAGKWTKRDLAADALVWARQRAASMKIEDLAARLGGEVVPGDHGPVLRLPYFTGHIRIHDGQIQPEEDFTLNRWEQVFIFNHMAQGGSASPSGTWRALEQIPNTISKITSMQRHVEQPLVERFNGRAEALRKAAVALGAQDLTDADGSADAVLRFQPLPKIPVLLKFWNAEPDEGFAAGAKLLFDETICEHLDIESIMFLCERIRELLCETDAAQENTPT